MQQQQMNLASVSTSAPLTTQASSVPTEILQETLNASVAQNLVQYVPGHTTKVLQTQPLTGTTPPSTQFQPVTMSQSVPPQPTIAGQQLPSTSASPSVHFQVHPPTMSTNLSPTFGFDSQPLLQQGGTGASSAFNNPYIPPPVPNHCINKIKNLEYVDFGSILTAILPNSSNMASITEGEDIEEFCLSQIQQPGAAATFRKKSARNPINNFPTWVMAWNVFYETTLHFHPEKHYELFSYFKHISEFSVNHKFNFLAAYDKAHRTHIAAQKNLPPSVQTSS